MIWQIVLASLSSVVLAQTGTKVTTDPGIVITQYENILDLTTQNPSEMIAMIVSNKSPKAVSSIVVLVPSERRVIGASAEDAYGQKLDIKELNQTISVNVDGKSMVDFRQFEITPQQPISPEYELKISKLRFVYNSFYVFKPKSTDLFDSQKVLVRIYKTPASPYKIIESLSEVITGDEKKTNSYNGDNLAPLTATSARLHFPLNIHFLQSSTISRYIEISHWGNIYFKDLYKLHNRAAKFRGSFSTIDFNKNRKDTGRNAFRGTRVRLPANAWGLFYRDEIGNITTSAVKKETEEILVDLRPRWSLLGDWNCTWDISYNVPTDDILRQSSSGSTYKFEYKVGHLLEFTPSDIYEFKVALPEGASILSHKYFGIRQPDSISTTKSWSYMDFLGRPTLVFTFSDYLPRVDQNAKVVIEYSLQSSLIFIDPIYLMCGLMLCFLFYLAYSKFDLSFGSDELVELQEQNPKPKKQIKPDAKKTDKPRKK